MNNNEEKEFLDVEELYRIAKRLKEANDERIGMKKILEKNPSANIRERYSLAKVNYTEALSDFNHLVEKYIYLSPNSISPIIFTEDGSCKVISKDNKISEIQKDRLLSIIQEKINEELDKYFKNGEVK